MAAAHSTTRGGCVTARCVACKRPVASGHVIFLVRHGETDANAARVVQTPDVPLSARGREQARALATRLAGEGVAHIVSSDLARADETARTIAAATGAP